MQIGRKTYVDFKIVKTKQQQLDNHQNSLVQIDFIKQQKLK